MLNRKLIVLSIFLVSLLAVSAVSAADNVAEDVVSVEEDQVVLEENFTDVGSFMELSDLIDKTPEGATLELSKDYQNNGSVGIGGVNITKAITVDGKNHVLDAQGSSRIFNVEAGNVTLKNIVFKNGFAGDMGGGAVNANASCEIANCSFVNNSAYYGGAIFNCIATDCYFADNTANSGGAAYDCSAIDSRFENNNAQFGGAIAINDENCFVSGCSFMDCCADVLGGAIFFSTFSKGNVENSIFINDSSVDGGAIYVFTAADIRNCNFTDNSANVGGAIRFGALSSGSVGNCIFVNNNASEGGAIYVFNSVEVSFCNFTDNFANLGAGIYFNESNCVITNSTFTNSKLFSENPINMHNVTVDGEVFNTGYVGNFSELSSLIKRTISGGTLYLFKDYKNDEGIDVNGIHIMDSIIIDGRGHTIDADGKSRIFNIGNDDVTVPDVNLMNIVFKNGYSKYSGGAVNCYDTNDACNISNCIFIDCSAKDGGAINFDLMAADNIVVNCSFVNCSAIKKGGAIFLSDGERFWLYSNVDNCSFIGCSAESGGGIYVDSGAKNVAIRGCGFVNCSSTGNGGGIFSEIDNVRISASYFENNKAKSGSALFDGIIFDCELKNNSEPAIHSSNNYAKIVSKEMASDQDGIVTLKFPKDAKGTIEAYVNGTSIGVSNIEKGSAKIDLSKYVGNCMVAFAYSGDSNYNAFKKDSNVTVIVIPAKIVADNVNVLYKSDKTYKIKVYKESGVIASKAKVVVKINGKSFKILTTDSKGVASFKITQAPGTYKITMTSLERIETKTLTVKHLVTLKSATVKKSAKKLVLTATLAKINKKYLKNKQVTFKFNGKTYKAKTDSKGVAKVTIKSSALKSLKVGKKVTYQATYLKDTVKKTANVKK